MLYLLWVANKMTLYKLIFRNIKKNISDYAIYFFTLTISISLFYAFNSISSQPAMQNLSITKQLVANQLGIFISTLSFFMAIILGFLIVYSNQFLLKRRKKELGIYTLLGMKKRKISRMFVGETIFVGFLAIVTGIVVGVIFSQLLSLLSLRLFAVEMSEFKMVFSITALKKTIFCFMIIFIIVAIFNVRTVSSSKLIDLLKYSKKTQTIKTKNIKFITLGLAVSIIVNIFSFIIFHKYGILPSSENYWFQIAFLFLTVGTIMLFYFSSAFVLVLVKINNKFYLKGLNSFLSRQVTSKIQTDFLLLAIITGLLTVSICGISIGISSALAMNKASSDALPYDLNIVSNIKISGDTDIVDYLKSRDINISTYANNIEQISLYEADTKYKEIFEGQDLELWPIDEDLLNYNIPVIGISDFNNSLKMQEKQPIQLNKDEYLVNCNYKGTLKYVDTFLKSKKSIILAGKRLKSHQKEPLNETIWMTSIGNNDRGTFIVSDDIAKSLTKEINVLLVMYKQGINPDDIIKKINPIGLEWKTGGYRYTEKNMLNDMFYGSVALYVFLSCYIGIVFLITCAALLSLKQLTDISDNIYRYGLLQKLGTDYKMLYSTVFKQVGVFFIVPLIVAMVYSFFGIKELTSIVEDFLNINVSTNLSFTLLLFIILYGSYFYGTYRNCKRMVAEQTDKK